LFFFAKYPVRPKQKKQNENDKCYRILPFGWKPIDAEILCETDKQPAERGAGEAVNASDDHRHDSHHQRIESHRRRHIRIKRDHDGGDGGEKRADGKGIKNIPVRVDAAQLCKLCVVRQCSESFAKLHLRQNQRHQRNQNNRRRDDHDLHIRDPGAQHRVPFDHLAGAHRLRIVSPGHGDNVLQQRVQPERCDEERKVGRFSLPHLLIHQHFAPSTQHHRTDACQRKSNYPSPAKLYVKQIRKVSAKCVDCSMSEMKEAGGLIDEGEAEGDKGVDASGNDSVKEKLIQHNNLFLH